ncbi:MAG: SpoIIIAH-like family protein [Clostridia bacterium]|nr:SpoIIIAH-like family protein [Clostridia bacterium]
MKFKVSVIKKNQILTWSVTLMLLVAGYLNYQNDNKHRFDEELTGVMDENLGDAVFVDSNNLVTNIDSFVENMSDKNVKLTSQEYFSESRINRNNQYAEQIEIYQKIIKDKETSEGQKNFATAEIKRINEEKNAISIAENLIKLKGIDDAVILLNSESANVIVLENDLDDAKVAQIQNIIQNELGVNVDNIHINSL